MNLTITIQDPGELNGDEIKDALMQSLQENGINAANGNIDIEVGDDDQSDQPQDPEDVTQNPPMPPGGQGKQLRGMPTGKAGPMTAGGMSPGPSMPRPKSQ